ncbi:MAG TPA: hypothetical protein DDX29_11310 [Clostridiales bacterium]|nr:MAG: hypothetical protein XD95_0341 [Microgenomates bacterium 39_7]HBH13682.1 hypothetical protein [Clostridiales bacterium]
MSKLKIILAIALTSTLIVFLNLYPHWHAYLQTPDGFVFSKQATWFDPWDINVYVAAIRWGQYQGFLMENMYDSQSNQAIVYYPLYTATGLLLPKIEPFLLFYFLSIVSTILLVSVITIGANKFIKEEKAIILAPLITALAGGWGFLTYPYIFSLDSSMTSFTFHSAFQRPHEGLALAAYLASFICFYKYLKNKQLRCLVGSFFSLTLTLIFYPYYLVSFFAIFFFYLLFSKKKINYTQITAFIGLNILGTTVALLMQNNLSRNESFSGVVSQQLENPTVLSLFSGFGLFLIPIFYYLLSFNKLKEKELFLIIWIGVDMALAFSPVGYARFFLRGAFFPASVLMILIIKKVSLKVFPDQFSTGFLVLLISTLTITSMTNLSIFAQRLLEAETTNSWYYLPNNEYQALEFIQEEIPHSSVILASYHFGNLLPAHSNQKVFFGHLIQTPNAEEKQQQLINYYSQTLLPEESYQFLLNNKINYIYYGEQENEIFEQLNLEDEEATLLIDNQPFVKKIFENQTSKIFQFLPDIKPL